MSVENAAESEEQVAPCRAVWAPNAPKRTEEDGVESSRQVNNNVGFAFPTLKLLWDVASRWEHKRCGFPGLINTTESKTSSYVRTPTTWRLKKEKRSDSCFQHSQHSSRAAPAMWVKE